MGNTHRNLWKCQHTKRDLKFRLQFRLDCVAMNRSYQQTHLSTQERQGPWQQRNETNPFIENKAVSSSCLPYSSWVTYPMKYNIQRLGKILGVIWWNINGSILESSETWRNVRVVLNNLQGRHITPRIEPMNYVSRAFTSVLSLKQALFYKSRRGNSIQSMLLCFRQILM